MKLSQVEWGTVGKAAIKEYGKDDIAGLAAEMAYWIVFALFPFFIFLAFLAGIVGQIVGQGDLFNTISNNVLSALDQSTRETISKALAEVLKPSGGALSLGAIFSAILALNSASAAVDTMMKAFNRAYGVEETRNFVIKKLTSLALTLALIVLIIGGSIFLSVGGDLIGKLNLGPVATLVLSGLRIVGALAAISLGLAILYWKAPNLNQQFQWISPGAVIATVALIAFSAGFSIYVRVFAGSSFNKTYGALAGIIIFLFFLRLASTIILLGAEFNAEAAMRYDPDAIRDKVQDPEKVVPGEQPRPHPQAAREAGVTPGQAVATGTAQPRPSATGNAANATYPPAAFDDPAAAERLRALRERPAASALVEVRAERSRRTAADRAAEGKGVLVALGASIAAAIVGAITGAARRWEA